MPRGCGGMADAHGSGPCVRKDVGVQLPPSPPDHLVTSCPRSARAGGDRHFCSGGRAPGSPALRWAPFSFRLRSLRRWAPFRFACAHPPGLRWHPSCVAALTPPVAPLPVLALTSSVSALLGRLRWRLRRGVSLRAGCGYFVRDVGVGWALLHRYVVMGVPGASGLGVVPSRPDLSVLSWSFLLSSVRAFVLRVTAEREGGRVMLSTDFLPPRPLGEFARGRRPGYWF